MLCIIVFTSSSPSVLVQVENFFHYRKSKQRTLIFQMYKPVQRQHIWNVDICSSISCFCKIFKWAVSWVLIPSLHPRNFTEICHWIFTDVLRNQQKSLGSCSSLYIFSILLCFKILRLWFLEFQTSTKSTKEHKK